MVSFHAKRCKGSSDIPDSNIYLIWISFSRSIGPILTSKHVMKPFSRLGYKDPISLPLLRETLGGIAQEFGSTFALVQFSHIMHLLESASATFTVRSSTTMKNFLGLLSSVILANVSLTMYAIA